MQYNTENKQKYVPKNKTYNLNVLKNSEQFLGKRRNRSRNFLL